MTDLDVRQAQLFVDGEIISFQTRLERVVHQPARWSTNPVLGPDKPWEGPSISFIAGVYRDERVGLFRMWYVAASSTSDGSRRHVLCTATSEDGLHWTKPELDLCRDAIGEPSNVLFAVDHKVDGPTAAGCMNCHGSRPACLRVRPIHIEASSPLPVAT